MYLGIPLSSLKCECSRFRKGIKFAVKAPWKEENLWMGRAGPQARTIACSCQQDCTAKTSLCPHWQVMKHCPWLFRKRYSLSLYANLLNEMMVTSSSCLFTMTITSCTRLATDLQQNTHNPQILTDLTYPEREAMYRQG